MPSPGKGMAGVRAPKIYRPLQHRCMPRLWKTTTRIDPVRRRRRFGAQEYGATNLPPASISPSHTSCSLPAPQSLPNPASNRWGEIRWRRWQPVVCYRLMRRGSGRVRRRQSSQRGQRRPWRGRRMVRRGGDCEEGCDPCSRHGGAATPHSGRRYWPFQSPASFSDMSHFLAGAPTSTFSTSGSYIAKWSFLESKCWWYSYWAIGHLSFLEHVCDAKYIGWMLHCSQIRSNSVMA